MEGERRRDEEEDGEEQRTEGIEENTSRKAIGRTTGERSTDRERGKRLEER